MSYRQSNDPNLTKLTIAANHVTASLQLIAIGANPFTTQLAVMAADELIETLAKSRGISLPYDAKAIIKAEHLGDWKKLKRKPYNFFKHADRDTDEVYAGPDEESLGYLNELQTMFNVFGLRELGHVLPAHMVEYNFLLGTFRPQYMKWNELEAQYPALAAVRKDLPAMDHDTFVAVLKATLVKARLLV